MSISNPKGYGLTTTHIIALYELNTDLLLAIGMAWYELGTNLSTVRIETPIVFILMGFSW